MIRTIIKIILFMLVSFQCMGQGSKTYNDSGNITFELIKEKIIIPVQINGNTYRFLVDTGGIFEISEKLQEEFNFDQKESTTIIDINRNKTELKTVTVPEINIGNWSFKNRNAIVSNLHNMYPYSCFELDGMIGRDFFDTVLLHFDLASNTFRLTENAKVLELDTANRTKLKLSKRGLPDIKLKLNGKTRYIEFDSGSGDFYSPKTSDVEKALQKGATHEILVFQGIFSFGVTMDNIQPTNRYIEKVERFQIANTTFDNFYTQFSKVSAPRIGAAILKYGTVTLDYKNKWFYYQPYAINDVMDPFITFGFDIAIEDGTYTVKYILKDSDAAIAGLRPGTKILKIDGISTQNIPEDCNGYLNGYAFKNNDKIKLTYLDTKGTKKEIELTKNMYK